MTGHVILIGYRGSGKTTVGRLLAERLAVPFVDADDVVEASAGQSVADIFRTEGEAGFRDREAAAIAELCSRPPSVLATGGGAILRPATRELLRQAGFVAWLTADPDELWGRITGDPMTVARRPNLTAAGGVAEVSAVTAAREPLYRETAHVVVPTAGRSPEQVAANILDAWRSPPLRNETP